jgi:hypothetical protein
MNTRSGTRRTSANPSPHRARCWRTRLLRVGWGVALVAVALASAAFAQEIRAEYDAYGQRTLTIDGWRLVIPRMYQQRDTGVVWLDWQYPDGTGRGFGYPLDDHRAITGRDGSTPEDFYAWFREGEVPEGEARVNSFSLPGYSVEYVAELLDWWSRGGDGCYVAEAGGWRDVPCAAASAPTTTPAPTASGCVPGGGPFAGGCIVIGGVTMTEITDPFAIGMTELAQAMQAAQQACNITRNPDVCAEYYRLYAAYNQRILNR